MSQEQTYKDAGFGAAVPRGTRPAIVVVDFTYGFTDTTYPTAADMSREIAATRKLTDAAREAGFPVIYTTISYHRGEVAMLPWLKKATGMAALLEGSRLVEIDAATGIRPEDAVVVKKGASAFFGSTLAALLAGANVDTVVVTGATGGVGSFAVDIFTAAGYEVHAITGKVDEFDYLESLGAKQCISRHDLHWGQKPLETARWAGAFDNVGGDMLNGLTRVVGEYGNIVSCGLAGGIGLNTTVMPFILRGVSLLGVSSENCPHDVRATLWQRLASEWKPPHLDQICTREIAMDGLMDTFESMLTGRSFGRTVVMLNSGSSSK